MTLQGASDRLAEAVEELWSAVTELMLIVAEDQPGEVPGAPEPGLAVADDLVEAASEVQGDVAAVRELLAPDGTGPAAVLRRLPAVAGHLAAAERRHRTRLREHTAVAQLRAATRRRGGQWPSWQRSTELTAARCQERFDEAGDALLGCFDELCQLLAPRAAPTPPPGTGPAGPLRAGAPGTPPPHPRRRIP